MLPVIIGVDGNVIFNKAGSYGKTTSGLFLKSSGSLGKPNLMEFLFVVHESPPFGYRSNCENRTIDTKIFGTIIS